MLPDAVLDTLPLRGSSESFSATDNEQCPLLESTSMRHAREAALFLRFKRVFSRTTLASQRRDPSTRWSSRFLPTPNQLRSDGVNGEIQVHSGRLRSLYWKVRAQNATSIRARLTRDQTAHSFTLVTCPCTRSRLTATRCRQVRPTRCRRLHFQTAQR